MPIIELPKHDDDDAAFVFRAQHILVGAVRQAQPTIAHFTKLNNWFGVRWLGFAGNKNEKDFYAKDGLCVPPFAKGRVVAERTYRREERELKRIRPLRLHQTPATRASHTPRLSELHTSGLFCWHSGNTAHQDRGSIMVYEVIDGEPERYWYAELRKKDGVWSLSTTAGTSPSELANLETSYENHLEPLYQHAKDIKRQEDKKLWEKALAVAFEGQAVAQATVLIGQYRSRRPDNVYGRLLHARNLGQRRLHAQAEEELKAIESEMRDEDDRPIWLDEWAMASKLRADLVSEEAAYRELASGSPEHTKYWIYLGSCLARQGKLDEAEAIHRHATELRGNPDEAFLNLGLVLRAQGRLPEAEKALEAALRLSPDSPEAATALGDVQAAIALE